MEESRSKKDNNSCNSNSTDSKQDQATKKKYLDGILVGGLKPISQTNLKKQVTFDDSTRGTGETQEGADDTQQRDSSSKDEVTVVDK